MPETFKVSGLYTVQQQLDCKLTNASAVQSSCLRRCLGSQCPHAKVNMLPRRELHYPSHFCPTYKPFWLILSQKHTVWYFLLLRGKGLRQYETCSDAPLPKDNAISARPGRSVAGGPHVQIYLIVRPPAPTQYCNSIRLPRLAAQNKSCWFALLVPGQKVTACTSTTESSHAEKLPTQSFCRGFSLSLHPDP